MDHRSEDGSMETSEREATGIVLVIDGEGIFGKYIEWRADRIFFFFYGYGCSIWKFPGQDRTRTSQATPVRLLTHCATTGTLFFFLSIDF